MKFIKEMSEADALMMERLANSIRQLDVERAMLVRMAAAIEARYAIELPLVLSPDGLEWISPKKLAP